MAELSLKCWQRWSGTGNNQNYSTESAIEHQLKKYLLLLATLVATVTYAAGLNVPGGAWLEDDAPEGHLAGDSILRETSYGRYIVFYYFNAISFAASLLVGLLLLIVHEDDRRWGNWLLLQLVRTIMVVDLLGLMGAYAVGSSHDRFTTICSAAVLSWGLFAYATVALITRSLNSMNDKSCPPPSSDDNKNHLPPSSDDLERQKKATQKEHEILLVLTIFSATIAYVAGLNPPGGFWRSTEEGHHTAGEPVLQALHRTRYRVFFFFNTTGFVSSLLGIMLVVSFGKLQDELQARIWPGVRKLALYGPIFTALLGLGGAYGSGSCRDSKHTIYIVLVAASVSLLLSVAQIAKQLSNGRNSNSSGEKKSGTGTAGGNKIYMNWDKTREDLQLLAILVATIAYTAGVDPPGGVWAESGHGHNVGDPILLTTHPVRYRIFFYCNSAALVAALVIMVMLQSDRLVRKHALEAVMILDLFALIGAFAAGGARDTTTSVYTVALAGVVLIYVVIHIVFFTLDSPAAPAGSTPTSSSTAAAAAAAAAPAPTGSTATGSSTAPAPAPTGGTPTSSSMAAAVVPAAVPAAAGGTASEGEEHVDNQEDQLQKRRDVLLLLSILAATLTYQAGLTPPGGTWEEDGGNSSSGGHRAGFPVLLDKFPLRYKTFYYFNAASFMASVALIVLLLNQNLYKPGIRCYALYVCMVAGMLGLMGAYSAGSSLHLKTSIVVLVFASLLTVAAFGVAIYVKKRNDKNTNKSRMETPTPTPKPAAGEEDDGIMYLMLVGIMGASVTYLTGLKPPGGTWRADGDGHSAGNPVLYDTGKRRYNAFFYSNSTSFMISINIIAWLLVRMISGRRGEDQASTTGFVVHRSPLYRAMLLDLLALLGAYAAGSARKWGTSSKVVVMLVPVLLIVWLVLYCSDKQTKDDNTAATGQQDNIEMVQVLRVP